MYVDWVAGVSPGGKELRKALKGKQYAMTTYIIKRTKNGRRKFGKSESKAEDDR